MSETSQLAILRQEHDLALALMGTLRSRVERLLSAEPWSSDLVATLGEALRELKSALLLHFSVEEDGLYPDVRSVVAEGAPQVDILTAFFGEASDDDLKAHTLLRNRLRELTSALDQAEQQAPSQLTAARLTTAVSLAHDLLGRHADKETRVIFPIIERLLDREQMASAEDRMREVRRRRATSLPLERE